MKYPLGIQNFEGLRTDGYLYMDKTAMVYDIAKDSKFYFLSRPRRLFKIGINFSTTTRRIEGWKIA